MKFFIDTANLKEIQEQFGIELDTTKSLTKDTKDQTGYEIYNFPCSSKPFDAIYNLKKKLPLFTKSQDSKSLYCAGHYAIKFNSKGWVKSFCPKLITLERYKYYGPFKTEQEVKLKLNSINKNETAEYHSN